MKVITDWIVDNFDENVDMVYYYNSNFTRILPELTSHEEINSRIQFN